MEKTERNDRNDVITVNSIKTFALVLVFSQPQSSILWERKTEIFFVFWKISEHRKMNQSSQATDYCKRCWRKWKRGKKILLINVTARLKTGKSYESWSSRNSISKSITYLIFSIRWEKKSSEKEQEWKVSLIILSKFEFSFPCLKYVSS